jgi:hypothetical protein
MSRAPESKANENDNAMPVSTPRQLLESEIERSADLEGLLAPHGGSCDLCGFSIAHLLVRPSDGTKNAGGPPGFYRRIASLVHRSKVLVHRTRG